MEPCGIYKITNLFNNKKYIGQSRRIFSRWKQHTQSLSCELNHDKLPPLRRAFVKYGLTQQVSNTGIYSGFKFEIIEECDQCQLDEAEYKWINDIKPEYNIMMQEPSIDKLWPNRERLNDACYIQYHNANELGYYPFESMIVQGDIESYITSKKRDCLRCKGEKVYLIVGLKTDKIKRKRFFLWGYSQIEEIEAIENDEGKVYGLKGVNYFCETPLLLNELPGFESFLKNTMGSFAYGLQNAAKDLFSSYIRNAKYVDISGVDKSKKYLDYIANFELQMQIDDEFHLIEYNDDASHEIALFYYFEDESIIYARLRTLFFLINYPEVAIQQISKGNYSLVHLFCYDGVLCIIQNFPSMNFVLYYEDELDLDSEFVKELRFKQNVSFEKMA